MNLISHFIKLNIDFENYKNYFCIKKNYKCLRMGHPSCLGGTMI